MTIPGVPAPSGMPYADMILEKAPAWLRGFFGAGYLQSIGLVFDAIVQSAYDAILQRMPSYATPDGLLQIAIERHMERGPRESEAHHREKLRNAWTYWRLAGQAIGLQLYLNASGYPNVEVIEAWQCGLTADGWATFWVVIKQPHAFWVPTDGMWSDAGTWGDGSVWDDGIDPGELAFIRRSIRLMKGVGSHCGGIAGVLSGQVLDGTWFLDGSVGLSGNVALEWSL